jgi:excisionase family DNA binding protein
MSSLCILKEFLAWERCVQLPPVSPLADVAANQTARGVLSMNEMEDRWLSITEICKYLGVSNDTVYKWIDRHGMPAHRMGRLWKFKKRQVDAWVESGGAAEPGSGTEKP